MSTALPFRPPARVRQSSISFNPPLPIYQDQNVPPRAQPRSRAFSIKLPSLRERSNETNANETAALKPLNSNPKSRSEIWRDYMSDKDAVCVAKTIEIDPHIAELQKRCAARLEDQGGDLTLDHFTSCKQDKPNGHLRQVSSSSSVYGGVGSLSPPNAPGSPPCRGTLNLRDIEKYSRANDRLSNLRSSTDSVGSGGNSIHGAAEDAAEVAQGWSTVLSSRPKKNPFVSGKGERFWTSHHDGKTSAFYNLPHSTEIERTYDGAWSPQKRTVQNSTDTSSSTDPTTVTTPSHKRKASSFSLRSISSSIAAKRPRLNFHKLASSVSSHFSEAKRRIKQHNTANRRNFEA